jgi:excisionase family DNA binding protein
MSPAAYAKHIGISRAALYKLIHRGEIVARKAGRRTLIFHADNEDFRESLPRLGGGRQ